MTFKHGYPGFIPSAEGKRDERRRQRAQGSAGLREGGWSQGVGSMYSFILTFTHAFITHPRIHHPSTHSPTQSLPHSLIYSLTHSSFIYSLTHSITHSFIRQSPSSGPGLLSTNIPRCLLRDPTPQGHPLFFSYPPPLHSTSSHFPSSHFPE